jgi:hypothetical protein
MCAPVGVRLHYYAKGFFLCTVLAIVANIQKVVVKWVARNVGF